MKHWICLFPSLNYTWTKGKEASFDHCYSNVFKEDNFNKTKTRICLFDRVSLCKLTKEEANVEGSKV